MSAYEFKNIGRIYRRVERENLAAKLCTPPVRAQDANLRGRLLRKCGDESALRAYEREEIGLHSVASEEKARSRARCEQKNERDF